MDRFLEESVSKHHRAAEEVLYYASWVVMIVSAILAFMYLNVMFYSFSISMLVMTLVFTGIAVYIFFFHDRLRCRMCRMCCRMYRICCRMYHPYRRMCRMYCQTSYYLYIPSAHTSCFDSRYFLTARSWDIYPLQRHRLPARYSLISSSPGSGFSRKSASAFIIKPGLQKPHCSAP